MWAGASHEAAPRRRSPAVIGLPRRSVFSDVDEGRAIHQACLAARGNVVPTPVVFGGRIVGVVRGESPLSPRVAFQKVPAQYRMAWNVYNDTIASLAGSQQRLSRMWTKDANAATVAGNWFDLWPVTGIPTAGSLAGAANTAIAYTDASTGAFYLGGNVAPKTKYITSAWAMTLQNMQSTFLIYDRVLDYQSNAYTAAASQAMTNVAVAARYVADGEPGLQMTWATDTIHNATASNITVLTYTDNLGAASLMPTTTTVSIIVSGAAASTTLGSRIIAPATAATTVAWGPFLPLVSGTTGARKVVDYTTSAANTGTFVLALIYPLVYIPVMTANIPSYAAQVFQIGEMPIVKDGACVALMHFTNIAASANAITGVIDVGWG